MSSDELLSGWVERRRPWFPADAARLLHPPEKVVPVLGAGVSRAACLDDAATLAEWILQLPMAVGVAVADYHRKNLFVVTDAVVRRDLGRALELRKRVAEHLTLREGEYRLTEALIALVNVPSRLIITFNYDELPEAAAASHGVPYRSVTHEHIDLLQAVIAGETPEILTILHLHGSVADPISIILDWDGYRRHITNGRVEERFKALAHVKNFLFLGMSMNEPYLLSWLQELDHSPPRHVYVCGTDVDEVNPVLRDRHGTIPAAFPKGQYGEIDLLVTDIFGRPR